MSVLRAGWLLAITGWLQLVRAIQITAPDSRTTWNREDPLEVDWTSDRYEVHESPKFHEPLPIPTLALIQPVKQIHIWGCSRLGGTQILSCTYR